MKSIEVSVIPIELFLHENISDCVDALKLHFEEATGQGELKYYKRMSGDPHAYLGTDKPCGFFGPDHSQITRVIFDDTSCVFLLIRERGGFTADTKWALEAVQRRSILHERLIARDSTNPYKREIEDLICAANLDQDRSWPTYVLSFTILEYEENESIPESVTRILLEPSIAGFDDLVSRPGKITLEMADYYAEKCSKNPTPLNNHDLQLECDFYASWATVISQVPKSANITDETFSILVGLETRVQMIWNKCYSSAGVIDEMIKTDQTYLNFERMYLNFSQSFDDAQSVLSSVISSRAQNILDEIVKTSFLQREIDTLALKLNLMEKYLERKERKREYQYNVIIETMLVLIASTAFIDMLVGFPIIDVSESVKQNILYMFAAFALVFVPVIIIGRLRRRK